MFGFIKQARANRLLRSGAPRRIRIHSIRPESGFIRVAFEFIDPPGPWSMQFYEALPDPLADTLAPGTEALFYESEDGAKTRLLATADKKPLWPR